MFWYLIAGGVFYWLWKGTAPVAGPPTLPAPPPPPPRAQPAPPDTGMADYLQEGGKKPQTKAQPLPKTILNPFRPRHPEMDGSFPTEEDVVDGLDDLEEGEDD